MELTYEELAVVHHVRGNCHDSRVCALCLMEDRHRNRRVLELADSVARKIDSYNS